MNDFTCINCRDWEQIKGRLGRCRGIPGDQDAFGFCKYHQLASKSAEYNRFKKINEFEGTKLEQYAKEAIVRFIYWAGN